MARGTDLSGRIGINFLINFLLPGKLESTKIVPIKFSMSAMTPPNATAPLTVKDVQLM